MQPNIEDLKITTSTVNHEKLTFENVEEEMKNSGLSDTASQMGVSIVKDKKKENTQDRTERIDSPSIKDVKKEKLQSEIEDHRTERRNLEKYYEEKLEWRNSSLESALHKQENAVATQAKMYQSHIENVIYMLKQDYHRNIIEEELVKLSQNIAAFSTNFGPTIEPLDLSTKS